MKIRLLSAALAAAFVLPGAAWATNGYFSHGYGMKAKGMGGTATATSNDTFGGANNPASMVWVGNRWDIGIDWFSPKRNVKREGSGGGFFDATVTSDSNDFYIPEFGYNRMLNPNLSLGITVYGNGGMNTDYPGGQTDQGICGGGAPTGVATNMLCGTGRLGVDLMQLIIAPTVAYKVNANHSIGVSPLFGYQRFKVEGLDAFSQISNDPANLTNRGYDDSTGWGVRLGWQGKLNDKVTVGAAYSSKMRMSKFDKYKGLFAEQGDFDMPENWNIGVSFKATPVVTIAADYQRINYSNVKSIANASQQPTCVAAPPVGPAAGSTCLGGADGIGFGWTDVNVFKLGVEYNYSEKLTLRAGYNHGDNPIRSQDVTFNFIAPGVIEDHLTLGFTYAVDKESEVTMSYAHAFKNSVTGQTNPTHFPVGGNERIEMYQNSLGIAYGRKF